MKRTSRDANGSSIINEHTQHHSCPIQHFMPIFSFLRIVLLIVLGAVLLRPQEPGARRHVYDSVSSSPSGLSFMPSKYDSGQQGAVPAAQQHGASDRTPLPSL